MKMRKEKPGQKDTKRFLVSVIAALAFVGVFTSHAVNAQAEKKHVFWHDYCRAYVFNDSASMEKKPSPDAANQKPWLSYCDGYLEGLFQAWRVVGVICVPDGTRNFQISGSVDVLLNKSDEKDRQMPGWIAMKAWLDAFPCKKDK
jgi:hypothetical protein